MYMETIRLAQPQDAVAIAHVQVESWHTTYKDLVPIEHHPSYDQRLRLWQQVLSMPSREGLTIVAINEQGELVGFLDSSSKARDDDLNDYQVELTALYLLEVAQGHGLGRCLMQVFAEHFLQAGYESMLLWVFAQNPACSFYEALGGTLIKTEQFLWEEISYEGVAYGWCDIQILL